MNEEQKEKAKVLFDKQRELVNRISENRKNQEQTPKVKEENGAPNLHRCHNFGEYTTKEINKKQERLNKLYSKLSEKEKETLEETYEFFEKFIKELDWL
jgi:histidinol dehydrogenase